MIEAISGTEQFESARRVTAVPRRSWKCRSLSDVFLKALSQLVLKPSSVHGRPNELTRMVTADRFSFSAASSAAFSGGPTGMVTRRRPLLPRPFDCRIRMYVPS